MKPVGVELRTVALPLVAPFTTSFGTQTRRRCVLVRVETADGEGWGECVALADPLYSAEYVDGAADVLERYLVPALLAAPEVTAAAVAEILAPFRGQPMAKGALETAVLDAELRASGTSLATHLGATRREVDCGVSVGIMDSVGALVDAVADFVEQGYRRIKLKIAPGWDVEPVRAVRERFDGPLQVDANAAYSLADARHLARLDEYDLLLIEQPLPEEDLLGHASLATAVRTPVCLDESVVSARSAADAITVGACSIVNVKPGRVGGFLEARRVHDVCAAHRVPVWCGGMLETGLGRAANLAFAALPGCTLPGDTSASDRFYATDVTEPFVMRDGRLPVPDTPGIGRVPLPERLAETTESVRWITR